MNKRATPFIILFLIVILTVGVAEWRRTRLGYIIPPKPKPRSANIGPDMKQARESTHRVREDLSVIKTHVRKEEWTQAQDRVNSISGDWHTLERSTYLTNKNFVSGLEDLKSAVKSHDKSQSINTIRRLDYLIRVLEAAF